MAYSEEVTMMMSVVPGSLTGISAMMGGLASITNVFTDITRQIDATFGLIDASIITASTIVAQFGIDAAKAAGEFEQGLKVAQMVSGQTAQDMDYLRNKANELSVSFRTDIDQITEGLQTLGRAGLNSAAEQTEVLENGLSTAKLEGRDLNGVLEELIQNTALLGGNLKSSNFGEDSQYVNDLLVATSMTAPITTHDVSETLKYSGGIAAAAGANIESEQGKAILEDYMGAIAAFAQKGVTGSIAGTALRAFFNKPATQDSSVTEALASIHLKPEYLWEDDEQTMKPVSEQIRIINDQMKELNVSTMDQLQIWSKIVGGKMGQQMMKLDSDSIKELTSDIRSAESAGSLASGTFQTFQSKMKEMTEQGQVAFRQFGENAARVLTPLLEVLKRILEFFSNPIISGLAFVAAIDLIGAAITRVKNLFSVLKAELSTIRKYFTDGDKLMAVRPSTMRKNERFKSDNLSQKYPGQSPVNAYSKEKLLEAEENLQERGYSLEEIDILRSTREGKRFLNKKTNRYSAADMFPTLSKDELAEINDSHVIKTLVDNGLWEEKYSETFYKYGRNVNKVLDEWGDEINQKIFQLNEKKLNKMLGDLKAAKGNDGLTFTPEDLRVHAAEVFREHRDKDALYAELLKTNFSPLKNMDPFSLDLMYGAISRKNMELESQGKSYASNNVPFNNARAEIQRNFVNDFVTNLEGYIGSVGMYMGEDNSGYHLIMNALEENSLLPTNPALYSQIQEEIKTRGLKQKDDGKKKFLDNFKENRLSEGESILNTALLSREDFAKAIGPNLPDGVTYKELQKYMLVSEGIETVNDVIREVEPRRKSYESHLLPNLIGGDDLTYLFGPEAVSASSKASDFMDYNPFKAADRAEEEKFKEEKRKELEKTRNSMEEYFERKHESLIWTPEDLLKQHNQLDEPSRYIKKEDFSSYISKLYGKDIKISGSTRTDKVKNSLPFLTDWLTNDAFKNNEEFYNFATKTLGADIKKGSRTFMVQELNKFLYKDSIEKRIKDIEEQTEKNLKEFMEEQEKIKKELDLILKEKKAEERRRLYRESKEKGLVQPRMNEDSQYDKYRKNKPGRMDIRDSRGNIGRGRPNFKERRNRTKLDMDRYFTGAHQEPVDDNFEDGLDKIIEEREERLKKQKEITEETVKDNKRYFQSFYGNSNPKAIPPQYENPIGPRPVTDVSYLHNPGWNPSSPFYFGNNMSWTPEDTEIYQLNPEKYKEHIRNNQFAGIDPATALNYYNNYKAGTPFNDYKNEGLLSKITSKLPSGGGILDSLFTVGKDSLLGTAGARSTLSKTQMLGNAFKNVSDLAGGPFFIAIEAATTAIEIWKGMFEDYCNKMKEAEEKLTDAYSKLESADSALERTFKEGNPDAEQEEIDQMMYDTYEEMGDKMAQAFTIGEVDWLRKLGKDTAEKPKYEYDEEAEDGTVKKTEEELTAEEEYTKAIKENTGALYAAANEVVTALNNYVRISQDSWWGTDGWTGWLTDQWGGAMDKLSHWDTQGSTYTGNDNEFMLTQSQADEHYSGYTEMAGLMLEDFKDAQGNWISGMRTMMGEDVEALSKSLGQYTPADNYLRDMANFAAGKGQGALTKTQNAKLQQSMKQDPKTWKKLGKELAKRDVNKKLGKDITKNQNRIKGLTEKIRSTVGKGFKDSQIQRAAYIAQLQEMKKIADQAVVPIMQENLNIAGQTLSATGNVGDNTGNTVGTTGSTNENAAIIAGLVAIIARQSAKGEHYDQVLANGPEGDNDFDNNPGTAADKALYEKATQDGMDAEKFYKENIESFHWAQNNEKLLKSIGFDPEAPTSKYLLNNYDIEKAGARGYVTLAEMTAKMTGYNYDKISAMNEARKFADEALSSGASLSDIFATIDKNYTMSEDLKNDIINSYIAANEDDDDGSGGGGGGGGGGDSGDKDNTGTKKERVDLVLCNKKEIPKLNVNLFKKPPSFTILNKNFKLRDLKINTEDKPKAIMSSIKNAFIDVQKRSDPKIIQDEEAEYDPVAATDGNATPSGSAKTKTDSNKSSN